MWTSGFLVREHHAGISMGSPSSVLRTLITWPASMLSRKRSLSFTTSSPQPRLPASHSALYRGAFTMIAFVFEAQQIGRKNGLTHGRFTLPTLAEKSEQRDAARYLPGELSILALRSPARPRQFSPSTTGLRPLVEPVPRALRSSVPRLPE